MLVCLKLRRWIHIAESTRPESKIKARNDATDILFLLKWLANSGGRIDFQGMQRKAALLQGFHLFWNINPEAEEYLKFMLGPADLKDVGL
jgi:hypothetical protein